MPKNPDLLAKIQTRRIPQGVHTPYDTRDYVPYTQQPEASIAGSYIEGLLSPRHGIAIEGVSIQTDPGRSTTHFSFALHGDKLPTFRMLNLDQWRIDKSVELGELFNPALTDTNDSYHQQGAALLKRRVQVSPLHSGPYLFPEQVKHGDIGTEIQPIVLTDISAHPFVYRIGSVLVGEDLTRALVSVTTQEASAFLKDEISLLADNNRDTSARLQQIINDATLDLKAKQYQFRAETDHLRGIRDRLVQRTTPPQS